MRRGKARGWSVAWGAWIALTTLAARAPAAAAETPQPPAEPALPPIEEARPKLPPLPAPAPVPWQQHVEIGVGVSMVEAPISVDGDGKPTPIRFGPAPAFNGDLSWQVCRFFRFTGYVLEHDHPIQWGSDPLGLGSGVPSANAHMYSFGARFSPTLPIGRRVRLWITGGAGWGRVEYPKLSIPAPASVPNPANATIIVRERGESLFEVPVGLGGAIDIIPRWLSVRVELTGAFVPSQIGEALEHRQYIDASGLARDLPPMPKLDAVFVQSISLALHL